MINVKYDTFAVFNKAKFTINSNETVFDGINKMQNKYSEIRKIDPSQGQFLVDGTPNNSNRVEIGPTLLAINEWKKAGLVQPNLTRMREYRWQRLTQHIVDRDWGGLLMFDPLNIRYATDSTNMQLWNTHNPFRAVLLCADGYMVIWDYKNSPFLSSFNSLIKEQRSGADLFYFDRGDKIDVAADLFSLEITELIMEHGGRNMNLGLDKGMIHGIRALEAQGFEIMDGEECTEKCRSIKGPDEILAMKCASHSCELSIHEMQNKISIGMSEDAIWAELHKSNIARGGEWIETRLLTTGPRTNPWFQECGPRQLQNNEILAFDTDLIGCYGFCIDVSRTWWIGNEKPRADMVYAMQHAHEHIMTNMEMLKPDTPFRDLTFNGHQLDSQYDKGKYSCRFHGVGLCDEWPLISYSDNFIDGAFDYKLKAGMVLCVEALVSPEKGDFSIKLEDQVLVTEDGFENITQFPFCPHLMGET